MTRIWRPLAIWLLILALLGLPAIGMAADFELFWDPNCSADADLEGYFIYYKQDASVVDDPSGAIDVYVALTDIGFDPDNPSYLIADLLDDVRYCFAVTAWYGDEESGLSNEVCGINGTYISDPDPDPVGPEILKTNWQLVYVDSEEIEAMDGSAVNAFDGDSGTMWHTQLSASPDPIHPHEIIIDLGDTYDLNGFIYESYQVDGRIIDYDFFVGTSGSGPWETPVAFGVFANDANVKTVSFPETTGRYIRLVAYSEPNGNIWTTAAEIGVTGSLSPLPNESPVANAGGPYEVADTDDSGSEEVALDGSASWDGDGTITSYQWYENGTLIGTGVNPMLSFTVGTHTVTLTVTDSDNATHSDDTSVIVNAAPNQLPVADAGGPYAVTDTDDSGSEAVALDGSGSSDSDGTITSYKWYENGTLIGSGVNPTLSFAVGSHTVTLTVTDNDNATHSNETTVIVNAAPNQLPIANTGGPYEVTDTDGSGSEAVALDGSGSWDSDGTITSYQWYENGTLIGSGVNPTLSFAVGTHTVTLTVTDNDNATHSNDTTVIVNAAPNEIPVADTGGPYEVTDTDDSGSEAVALDGSGSSDSDGTITSYQWFENSTLIGTGVNPTLSFAVGTHTVTLTVSDNDNATHSNDTTVTVNSGLTNSPPNSLIDSPAGNQSIYVGESVYFSGTGSDPDGDTLLSYRWQFGAGSGIDEYTIDDSPGEIFFHNAGTFTVTFTVTDSKGAADPTPDTRVITVVEKSSSGPIAKTDWQLVYADNEELVAFDGAATNAFDGDSSTMWHTEWGSKDDPAHPHEIVIDLGHTYDLDGFSYEPYKRRGRIAEYEFFVSTGSNGPWTSVASGVFSNGANAKSVSFPVTIGRYFRLVAYSEAKGGPWTSAVEIGVNGTPRLP